MLADVERVVRPPMSEREALARLGAPDLECEAFAPSRRVCSWQTGSNEKLQVWFDHERVSETSVTNIF
jgi:hypothetical protein